MADTHRRWILLASASFGLLFAYGVRGDEPSAVPPSPAPTSEIEQPAALPLPASVKLGQSQALLFLNDGRRFQGVLMERTPAHYVLRIAGIDTEFSSLDVDRIRFVRPAAERYVELRKAVPDDDVEQRVKLVGWLVDRGELELARRELDPILIQSPEYAVAKRLNVELTRLLELKQRAIDESQADESVDGSPDAGDPPPTTPSRGAAVPLLTPEQINLMKVFEVDLTKPPTLTIPREVMTRAFEAFATNPLVPPTKEARDALLRAPVTEQLDLLFRLRARELYPQVKVQGQPETMRSFAEDVHRPLILNACATSACHGGEEAGRLTFATRKGSSEAALYTNFYILDRYKTDAGQPLLNWDDPERSLLLQMALPREQALARHPAVIRGPGNLDQWKPSIRGASDRRYQQVVAWMRSMYRPRPDYGIDYQPVRPLEPVKAPPAAKTGTPVPAAAPR